MLKHTKIEKNVLCHLILERQKENNIALELVDYTDQKNISHGKLSKTNLNRNQSYLAKIDLDFDNAGDSAFSCMTIERLSQNKHCSDWNEIKEGIKPVVASKEQYAFLLFEGKIFLQSPTKLSPRYSWHGSVTLHHSNEVLSDLHSTTSVFHRLHEKYMNY